MWKFSTGARVRAERTPVFHFQNTGGKNLVTKTGKAYFCFAFVVLAGSVTLSNFGAAGIAAM
jgi:hypothetical protein